MMCKCKNKYRHIESELIYKLVSELIYYVAVLIYIYIYYVALLV